MTRLALAQVSEIEDGASVRFAADVNPLLVEVTQAEGTIGRKPRGATIEFFGKSISATHLRYRREGDTLVVEDAGSSYGTFQNGSQISGPVTLNIGDHIRLASDENEGALLRLVRLI